MANKYRGFVEFTDSEGTKYVLRLGTNEYLAVEDEASKLDGRRWQRFMFHLALIHGDEAQKALTLEEAGEILDDIGYLKADELLNQTRFGKNAKEAVEEGKKKRDAEEKATGSANPPVTASNP